MVVKINRRSKWVMIVGLLLALVSMLALVFAGWIAWSAYGPAEHAESETTEVAEQQITPVPTVTPSKSKTPALTGCLGKTGKPVHVQIPDLGIDADVEVLRPDDGSIGDPKNKHNIGWFPGYPGVKPGAGKGRVLFTGHTYSDGSAVFKESFSKIKKIGMIVIVTLKSKAKCYYEVSQQGSVKADDYPEKVVKADLYDSDRSGGEAIFFATCSGWNGWMHTREAWMIATPVPNP